MGQICLPDDSQGDGRKEGKKGRHNKCTLQRYVPNDLNIPNSTYGKALCSAGTHQWIKPFNGKVTNTVS